MSHQVSLRQASQKKTKLTEYEITLQKKNESIIQARTYKDDNNELEERLAQYAKKFSEIDEEQRGIIDIFSLKRVFEKVGLAKTHLQVKEIINKVVPGKNEINYLQFVEMMEKKTAGYVMEIVMKFNKFADEPPKQTGLPPVKNISQLP